MHCTILDYFMCVPLFGGEGGPPFGGREEGANFVLMCYHFYKSMRDQCDCKFHFSQQKNLSGDLMFPSLEDASSTVVPQRQVRIPTFFQDAASYKQILTAVLRGKS